MIISQATQQYIKSHLDDDVRHLALHPVQDVDMSFALNQIQGYQTAKSKLPTWAKTEGIVYPPHLNMEQCSSEKTARYKQFVIHNLEFIIHDSQSIIHDSEGGESTNLIDLTGGFGVDFSFMAREFGHAVYVERDERLCKIAKHNFEVLGLKNVEVVNGDGVEFLKAMPQAASKGKAMPQAASNSTSKTNSNNYRTSKTDADDKGLTLIYLDPARRDTNGHKVYGIEDCTPDVLTLKDELLAKADCVMIKLSPMLDWHEAVRKLGDCVREVHIVSVGNECKELLMVLKKGEKHHLRLVCRNDDQSFACYPEMDVELKVAEELEEKYLYVPNASIMKAGIFAHLTDTFHVSIVDKNSHLFLSNEDISDFPGRKFNIVATTTLNKKELKEKLNGITKANISVRNFPLPVAELRKRLKLKDGGDIYLFATTAKAKHIIYICKACH